MLLVVEDRNEHINVRKQILQTNVTLNLYGVIVACSPLGKLVIKLMADRDDFIAQRFKQSAQESLTTATWKNRNFRLQRHPSVCQFGPALTPPGKSTSHHACDGHTKR